MMKLIGVIFLLAGCFGIYWCGKRSFERRNMAGVEEFASYGKAVGTKALKGTISLASKLSAALGFLMICVGFGLGK